jgi:hypothetical protein
MKAAIFQKRDRLSMDFMKYLHEFYIRGFPDDETV